MRPILTFLLGMLILPLALGVGYFAYLQGSGNFHSVIPGELYRSAQPSPEDIARYAKKVGIRSILNLRGPNPGVDWYEAEVKQAKELNIQLIDIPLLSRKKMTPEQEKTLIEMMRNAPKPLLIHCAAGANRTGMASAIYLGLIKGEDPAAARQQLSPIYGHLPFRFMRAYPMRQSMEDALAR